LMPTSACNVSLVQCIPTDFWQSHLGPISRCTVLRTLQLVEYGNPQWISQDRSLWTTSDAAIGLYDRDKKLRYRWEPKREDEWSPGFWSSRVVAASRRLIAADGDNKVRIWMSQANICSKVSDRASPPYRHY